MMHSNAPCDVMDKSELRKTRLAERQARVGIVANLVEVRLPTHGPREVWVRWPKLRSARRQGQGVPEPVNLAQSADPVLNGDRLKDFTLEVRQSEAPAQSSAQVAILFAPDHILVPPFDRARLAVRLAFGVLVAGLVLVGLSLALR